MPNVAERRIVGKCALLARGDRGVILLVVLAMLQLLALIGITFAVFASNGGPVDAIGRVKLDIQRAQAALTALLENPDDSQLQESALAATRRYGNLLRSLTDRRRRHLKRDVLMDCSMRPTLC